MSTTMLRNSNLLRSALRSAAPTATRAAAFSSSAPIKAQATLPDLPYDYGALEPAISGQIMELHHSKHHQTYVTNYNAARTKMADALQSGDIATAIATQPAINFNGGGNINHTLFWENLAPKSQGGGEPPSGPLAKSIDDHYGSLEKLKEVFNTQLAGIQGSGWCWLVQDNETGALQIKTYANQDPVVGRWHPLLGVDAWEHAYYLQYENKKVEYFKNIWSVINWKAAEKRMK
ncbi:Superoxide dismutase [Mn], mitochondrial [Elasticomyces elasticus]|nr:Superoxide dismutase [Mn], mitochondrial [Elasticomyces elasticus]KAK4978257.1 Superoxide dismutase [Mn], mitochondrial [Elasticomyces elasticus]